MYKLIKLAFLFLTICFCLGCISGKNKFDIEKTINVEINDSIGEFSKIFSEVKYIPLETNSKSLIGKPKILKYYKNRFYILDSHNNLFLFYKDGRFIKVINKHGKGPGETINIKCFIVDDYSETVLAHDNMNQKILFYNLNGDFIREKRIAISSSFFQKLDSSGYVFHSNNDGDYNIYITDNNYNIIGNYFPVEMPLINYSDLYGIFKNKEGVMITLTFSNKVYIINNINSKPKLKWEFDFGKYNIPEDVLNELKFKTPKGNDALDQAWKKQEKTNKQLFNKYARYIFEYKESGSHIFFKFYPENTLRYFLYFKNKETGKVFSNKIIDDINNLFLTYNLFDLVDNNLIGIFSPYLIEKYGKKDLHDVANLKGVDTYDNPIIAIYTLK